MRTTSGQTTEVGLRRFGSERVIYSITSKSHGLPDKVDEDSSYYNVNDGINTRVGAELLVQNNVFESVGKPLYSTDNGYANQSGNDFGGASSTALASESPRSR